MKRIILLLTILLALISNKAEAQPYYDFPHPSSSGTYSVGGVNVGFSYNANGGQVYFDETCPSVLGYNTISGGYFTFGFNVPIAGVRIRGIRQTFNSNTNIHIRINGASYTLNSSNLTSFSACGFTAQGSVSNGDLVGGNGMITIIQPGITSLQVQNNGSDYWIFVVEILPLVTTANNPCTGNTLNLTADFSGLTNGISYNWTGPNGFTSNQKNPSISNVTAANAGIYTVTVSNGTVTAKQTQNVTINPIPDVNTINNRTLCNGSFSNTVSFSSSIAPVNFTWNNDNPSIGLAASGTGTLPSFIAVNNSSQPVTAVITVTPKYIGNGASCEGTPKNFTITVNPSPAILSHPVSTTACANGNAVFSSIVRNASTYQWQVNTGSGFVDLQNTATYSGTSTSTLNISNVVAAANGHQYRLIAAGTCGSSIISDTVVLNISALSSNAIVNNVSCNGGSDGSIIINPSGGTSPYTFNWDGGRTAKEITELTAGTYKVTITDANLCSLTESFTITEPSVLTATKGAVNNVTCNGGSNGSATVNVTGGTGAYTYQWAPSGGTAATASGLSAGTYTVTVKDANLCQTTATVTIFEPTVLTAAITKTDVLCNQDSNGIATVIPSGGTAPYTYSWSPSGGNEATATELSPNNYTVTVTDANGCFVKQNVQITEPAVLSITDSHTNVSCNTGNDGTASVTVTGGTGAYTYLWAPSGGTAATATGLTAGTYTVTVTDAKSCSAVKTITITEPSALTATAAVTNVSCYNGNNGTVSVTATGGTGAYSYLWTPSGGTAATATDLAAGSYQVTIKDAKACSVVVSVNITAPENPVTLNTAAALGITTTNATLSGTVSSDGIDTDKGECLADVGFVYATHTNPGTADTKINVSTTLGTFTSTLSGLRGNRTYYVRTYAINTNGSVTYGNEVSFTTEKYVLNITASSGHTKVYGTTDPVFDYTATGFANADTNAIITGLLSRDPGENAGKYNIKSGSINAGADYTINFTGAEFEITKANQTITWNQVLEFGCDSSSTVTLTATANSGLPVSYTTSNSLLGTISGSVLNILGSGNYTITAIQDGDENHNAAAAIVKPIEISQSGLVILQWANVLSFDNSSNNFTAWQWYKDGTAISGETRQYYSENQPLNGTYYVLVKDKNGNSVKTCPIETTGTAFSKKLKIYPNPVSPSNQFTLECDFSESQLNGAEIKIFDITGKLVQTVSNVKANTLISAPSQSAIYIVVLTLSNGQVKTINLLVK